MLLIHGSVIVKHTSLKTPKIQIRDNAQRYILLTTASPYGGIFATFDSRQLCKMAYAFVNL
jgi:hypothetical protein